MKKICSILILLLTGIQLVSGQYLHRAGKYIVDGNNKPVILRGIGLGGWMLQEGYMMESTGFANTQHELKANISALVGETGMNEFYDAWLKNYCQKADVDSIASWGFNSIRLPLHYNLFTLPIEQEPVQGTDTWLTKGFDLVDSLLNWSADNHIYLILDLHAAPGGQGKDAAIADYDSSKPSLWENAENQRKTVALWTKLAERYANQPWIGGYDLINETNWDMNNNSPLRSLYGQITKAIRAVDTNHLIIIEGNWFANDFKGLTPPWDNNMAYSFHKYWSNNDQGSIQWMLDIRDQYNIPIWLGESGENSNVWFSAAIKLMENNQIGWAWWPYKKINSVTGTVTIPKTQGYQALLDYWGKGGAKPSPETAKASLLEQAEMLKITNCAIHYDVLDAMFRQVKGDQTTKPFKTHRLPGTIYATDFDLGKNNRAYFDVDSADYHVSTNTTTVWNSGYAYRNDAVDIQKCSDTAENNGYNVGWTADGEWLLYTATIDSTALYDFELRYAASSSPGKFHLELDGTEISPVISLTPTGAWDVWKSVTVQNLILKKGIHKIRLFVDKAGFNINYLKFSNPKDIADAVPTFLNAKTDRAGKTVILTSNLGFAPESLPAATDFSLTINGQQYQVNSVLFDNAANSKIILTPERPTKSTDQILVSYTGGGLKTETGKVYQSLKNLAVMNNSPVYYAAPGIIQAENYSANNGLSAETCTDTSGGLDMGYTHAGDYLNFLVDVSSNGTYAVQYRLASPVGGSLQLRLADDPLAIKSLHTVTVPNTGDWQAWQSVSANANLTKGLHTLQLYIAQPEFNINWFKISLVTTAIENLNSEELSFYPNPAADKIFLRSDDFSGETEVTIFDMEGRVVRQLRTETQSRENWAIDISALRSGNYILSVKGKTQTQVWQFIKSGKN